VGPGWVLGMTELCSGYRSMGTFHADTPCRLHKVSFGDLARLLETDTELCICIYKVAVCDICSCDKYASQLDMAQALLMAKRFDHCKEQVWMLILCI
jgi:hypothetical protein